MCRFTIYKGKPKLIGEVVVDPENSLLKQSRDAAYHPGVIDTCNKRNILVNGDGFGLSWYGSDVSKGGCCFKFVTPAWSDTNLRNIGNHVSSQLIFAHVRAANSGHDHNEQSIVSIENCHPFTYKAFTFMHNGGIPSFSKVKRRIIDLLGDVTYDNIKGSTDSEHIFALFLECLPAEDLRTPCTALSDMVAALNRTICIVESLCVHAGILENCSLNLCVTDGHHIIVSRFRGGAHSQPPSLYYNFGSDFVCEEGQFYAKGDPQCPSEVVICSAPPCKVLPVENANDTSFEADDTRMRSASDVVAMGMGLDLGMGMADLHGSGGMASIAEGLEGVEVVEVVEVVE